MKARGLMQFMPETARRFNLSNPHDAAAAIDAAARYVKLLAAEFDGGLELVLAGYNAGENAVERYGNRIPPYSETQNYVRKITGKYLTHRAGLVAVPAMPDVPQPAPLPPPQAPVVHTLLVEFDGAAKPENPEKP